MVGDNYYELDADYYHEDCFEDNAAAILTEVCGARKGVAEEEDCYEHYD